MSKLLNCLVDFEVYEGNQITNDPADATKFLSRLEGVAVTQCSRTQMSVATGGSYTSIPILAAGGSYLLVSTDQALSLKVNGGSEVLSLVPKVAGTKTFVLYFKGTISALDAKSVGSVAANIDVIVAI